MISETSTRRCCKHDELKSGNVMSKNLTSYHKTSAGHYSRERDQKFEIGSPLALQCHALSVLLCRLGYYTCLGVFEENFDS